MFSDVNIFAVIASVAMAMIIGSVWYSPSVLGKKWMDALKKTPEDLEKEKTSMNMTKLYSTQLLISFIGAYSLAFIITGMGITSIADAIIAGLIVSIGIIASNSYGNVLWGHGSREAFLIWTGGNIITIVVMSIILAIWQ